MWGNWGTMSGSSWNEAFCILNGRSIALLHNDWNSLMSWKALTYNTHLVDRVEECLQKAHKTNDTINNNDWHTFFEMRIFHLIYLDLLYQMIDTSPGKRLLIVKCLT